LVQQIDEAIRGFEPLFLILSPDSMNSEWVKTKTTIPLPRVFRTPSAI
jgi:hypothetical protein